MHFVEARGRVKVAGLVAMVCLAACGRDTPTDASPPAPVPPQSVRHVWDPSVFTGEEIGFVAASNIVGTLGCENTLACVWDFDGGSSEDIDASWDFTVETCLPRYTPSCRTRKMDAQEAEQVHAAIYYHNPNMSNQCWDIRMWLDHHVFHAGRLVLFVNDNKNWGTSTRGDMGDPMIGINKDLLTQDQHNGSFQMRDIVWHEVIHIMFNVKQADDWYATAMARHCLYNENHPGPYVPSQ